MIMTFYPTPIDETSLDRRGHLPSDVGFVSKFLGFDLELT